MKIIKLDDLVTQDEANELIETFCKESRGIKHYPINECIKSNLMKKVLESINLSLNEYAKSVGINKKLFYNTIAAIKQDSNTDTSDTNSLHFDDSVSVENGNLQISPCIVLLYLTSTGTDYHGGELIFPFQNQVVSPKVGRLVIFPTGYLHSHKVLPFFGGDRYLFRIIGLFDAGLDHIDSKRLIDRLDLKQEGEDL